MCVNFVSSKPKTNCNEGSEFKFSQASIEPAHHNQLHAEEDRTPPPNPPLCDEVSPRLSKDGLRNCLLTPLINGNKASGHHREIGADVRHPDLPEQSCQHIDGGQIISNS